MTSNDDLIVKLSTNPDDLTVKELRRLATLYRDLRYGLQALDLPSIPRGGHRANQSVRPVGAR